MIPEVPTIVPDEVKSALPSGQQIAEYKRSAKHSWNDGVLYVFQGLNNLPATLGGYASDAVAAISEQANATAVPSEGEKKQQAE